MERDRRGLAPEGTPEIIARAGLTLALVLAAVASPGVNALWGLAAGGLLPAPAKYGLLVAALAAVWWPWPAAKPGARRTTRLHAGALALLVVWILLPARTRLFGDGADIVARLGGAEPLANRSPLYSLVGFALAAVRPDVNREGLAWGLEAVAVLCGLLFVMSLLRAFRRGSPLHPASAALFAGGALMLFQRYIEVYPLALALLAAWCATAIEPWSRGRNVRLAILAAFVFAAHAAGILLVPVTLIALVPPGADLRRFRGGAIAVAGGAAAALVFLALFRTRLPAALAALDPVQIAGNFGRVALIAPRPWSGGLFSTGHLLDVVNGAWVALGAALFVLPALLAFSGGRRALLRALRTPPGIAALLFLAARMLFATSIGPLFDWDLMTFFVWPLAFALALAWSDPEAERVRRLSPAVLAAGIALAAPWALMLHSDPASARFVAAWRDGSPAPRPALAAHADHRLGNRLVDLGRQREAAELFSRAGERFPRDVYARRAGTAWLAAGDPARSKAEYAEAVRLNPDDLVSRRQLGFFALEAEDPREAAAQFAAVIERDPDDGRARFGLGLLAGQRGDRADERKNLDAAVGGLRANLATDPGNRADRLYLGEALNRLGRSKEALPELTRVLVDDPRDLRAVYNLGVCYANLGRLAEAKAIFAQGAAASPGDFKFAANLGAACLALESWPEAADAYTKALALRDVPVIRRDRARAFLEMGETERAREDIAIALAKAPDDSAARILKARIDLAEERPRGVASNK